MDWLAFVIIVLIIGWFIYDYFRDLTPAQKKKISENKKVAEQKLAKQTELLANAESRLNDLIQQHVKTLAVKLQQLTTKDAYGVMDVSAFSNEVDYFIEKVLSADEDVNSYLGGVDTGNFVTVMAAIKAQLDAGLEKQARGGKIPQSELDKLNAKIAAIQKKSAERTQAAKETIYKLVTEYRIKEIENQDGQSIDVDSLNPIEFEHYCAELLRNDGWDARVTQASGDQGIDVIATRGNVKAVFQCKKYAQPVGNGAVQEIVAGKQFEQADIAAVVSNATFTPSAKQLAGTTGVHLLHYSELHGLAEKLGMA